MLIFHTNYYRGREVSGPIHRRILSVMNDDLRLGSFEGREGFYVAYMEPVQGGEIARLRGPYDTSAAAWAAYTGEA